MRKKFHLRGSYCYDYRLHVVNFLTSQFFIFSDRRIFILFYFIYLLLFVRRVEIPR